MPPCETRRAHCVTRARLSPNAHRGLSGPPEWRVCWGLGTCGRCVWCHSSKFHYSKFHALDFSGLESHVLAGRGSYTYCSPFGLGPLAVAPLGWASRGVRQPGGSWPTRKELLRCQISLGKYRQRQACACGHFHSRESDGDVGLMRDLRSVITRHHLWPAQTCAIRQPASRPKT